MFPCNEHIPCPSYKKRRERYEAFVEWFIPDEQKAIIQITRDMVHEIFLANEICPQFISECDERRIHQDLALGHCENLIQELQYIITTLPVNIEKYENITNMISACSCIIIFVIFSYFSILQAE